MAVLIIVLKTIVAVLSVLLSLLILLHKGKGGGLSDMFGGGLTANAGTSGVAEKNLPDSICKRNACVRAGCLRL